MKFMDSLGTYALPFGHTWQGGLPLVENNSDDHQAYVALLEKNTAPTNMRNPDQETT